MIHTFAEIEREFIERAHAEVWCSAATVDSQQRPRSRVLHPLWEGRTGWIATTRHSPKSTHLAAHPYLSLAYVHDPFKPVHVECGAVWNDDSHTKQRVWELFKQAPPPLGYDPASIWGSADDPAYGVLRLTPWRIELYDLLNQGNRKVWRA